MKIRSVTVQNWLLPAVTVAAWEIFGAAGMLPRYLSTPSAILAALWELARTGELVTALAASLYRVATGFVLGTAAGMLVGLAAGIDAGRAPFLRPAGVVSLCHPEDRVPAGLLLLFGLGHASKIAIIAFSCFFPVFIASRHAVLAVNKLLVWTAQNMGTPPRDDLLPGHHSGVRRRSCSAASALALAHAFVVLFAAELIGSKAGSAPSSPMARSGCGST